MSLKDRIAKYFFGSTEIKVYVPMPDSFNHKQCVIVGTLPKQETTEALIKSVLDLIHESDIMKDYVKNPFWTVTLHFMHGFIDSCLHINVATGETYIYDVEKILECKSVSISVYHNKYPGDITFFMTKEAQQTEFDRLERVEVQKNKLRSDIKNTVAGYLSEV